MSEDGVKKSANPLVSLTSGCIAGGIECVAVWPMEYIKTQLQLQKGGQKPPFTGVISGLTYTVRTTGFFSLYRGLGVTLVKIRNYFNLQI
jgi:solute carrier family 25 citrate transporter 1